MAHLTPKQRYLISALQKRGVLQKEIAKELGVSPGTICRKLKRNSEKRGGYNAQSAHTLSEERKERYALKRKFPPMLKNTFDIIRKTNRGLPNKSPATVKPTTLKW